MNAMLIGSKTTRCPRQMRPAGIGCGDGADGQQLLQAIDAAVAQPWLREVPAVKTLRQVWVEQYIEVNGQFGWRESKTCLPQPPSFPHPMTRRPA